jgi:hypothetical protein
MPPAESILVQRICEVRPGADPVKCGKAKVAGDVLHTLHAVRVKEEFLLNRVEPRI